MNIKFIAGLIVAGALVVLFLPIQLNTRPKVDCTNIPDNAGGYVPVCKDPTFISIYSKYISGK